MTAALSKLFTFTPENLTRAQKIIAKYPEGRQASAVIPLLDIAQRQSGNWLPIDAMDYVADMLENGVHLIDGDKFVSIGFIPTGSGAHGLYPSRDMTARTFLAVAGAIPWSPFNARDAVFKETPASRATSTNVGPLVFLSMAVFNLENSGQHSRKPCS